MPVSKQVHHTKPAVLAQGASVLRRAELPGTPASRRFEGAQYGDIGVSLYWMETPPGQGPTLHPYAEVFVVQAGKATFTVRGVQHRIGAGQIVVVPPQCPHRFVNCGPAPLQMVAIHASARMEQSWSPD